MASYNDITGDKIATKGGSQAYRDNWDAIFGKPKKITQETFKHQLEHAGNEFVYFMAERDGQLTRHGIEIELISQLNEQYVVEQEGSERGYPRLKLK